MLDPGHVTGVILVGGKSSRMGRDKALLPVSGETLIGRVLATLKSTLQTILLIGDRPERFEGLGIPVLPDIFPGSSLGGLYTGLFRAETPYVFAAACDLPFASPELLRLMISVGEGFDAVVPVNGGQPEPLFALYHKNCLVPMAKLLESRNYRIRDIYPQLRVRLVPPEEFPETCAERAFLNVNTIEEYEAIRERREK